MNLHMLRLGLLVSLACAGVVLSGCEQKLKITTSSEEARKQYREGVTLLDKFYFAEAKSAFRKATQLDTNFAMAYARLGLLYYRAGSEDSARREITRAIHTMGEASSYEQLFIRMLDHLLHFRNAEALRVADSLTSLYPDDAEGFVFRGDLLELNKRADAALEMYKKAVKTNPSYAPAVMSLGYAYSARGNEAEAIKAMQRYIELVPDAADPRASFADILFRSGRYAEALEQYKASLDLKPDYWYAFTRMGDVYVVLGRLKEAKQQYEIGMSHLLAGAQMRASQVATDASLALRRGKYDEALRLFDEALALDSTSFRSAYGRTLALLKLKRLKEVEAMLHTIRTEILRRNLEESSIMLQFHLLQARMFEEQGRFDEALTACDSAFQYGTELTRTEVYHRVADIYLKSGDSEKALDALDDALRYNPNNPEVLLTLAKVYKAVGDKRMTREIGNRVLDLWKQADADFQPLQELKRVLAESVPPSPS
jgi:tetratricopeptide (TPR) repeat protein